MTRICVVVTARPSWAKLEPICRALRAWPDVELQIVACASALLERYGNVSAVIEASGYPITERVYSVYEGATLQTSVAETGALCTALGSTFARLRPDVVVVMADRHEILAAAQAASGLHIPLAHCQGGETSGSIDNKIRDSVTQLADYHFPCTELAKFRVVSLTGAYDRTWNFGCPSIDAAPAAQLEPPVTIKELGGAGEIVSLDRPFIIVLQHPVTNEVEHARAQMVQTLEAIYRAQQPTLVWWPGQDAGADAMSKVIREYQEWYQYPLHTVRNLPPHRFLRLMAQACVVIGNSSAGIREASYIGTPVVNIGSRQQGRQRGPNVLDVPHDAAQITQAIQQQMAHGTYPSSTLYGQGNAGERIAEVLAHVGTGSDTRSVRLQGL